MTVRRTQGRNRAAHITQWGVTLMVMDCRTCIIFIRIPDQVYCNKSQKTTFCLKHFFAKINAPSPFTQTWNCLALSYHVNVSVYVKRG